MSHREEEITLTDNINNRYIPGYGGISPLAHGFGAVKEATNSKKIHVRGYGFRGDEIVASYMQEDYNYKGKKDLPPRFRSHENEIERMKRKIDVPLERYKAPGMTWFVIFVRIFIAMTILLVCYILCHQRFPNLLPWPEQLDPWVRVDADDT